MDDQNLTVLTRLMDASLLRQQVHAANLANQNTPGYRARAVAFEEAFNQALDDQGLDRAMAVQPEVYQANQTMVQADGNDVSTETEIASLAKNQLLYSTYSQLARGKMRMMSIAISAAPGG